MAVVGTPVEVCVSLLELTAVWTFVVKDVLDSSKVPPGCMYANALFR